MSDIPALVSKGEKGSGVVGRTKEIVFHSENSLIRDGF